MIKLIEKQKIIISPYRKGKSQRQISKDLNINRRTIGKYIKDYEDKKAKLVNSKSNYHKTVAALNMAIATRKTDNLIHHSDQGRKFPVKNILKY